MLTRRHLLVSAAVTGLLLPVLGGAAFAQGTPVQASNATAFVTTLGNQLIGIINGPGNYDDKRGQLRPLIERSVDVDAIARFCLGRYWNTATPAQQAEYNGLFHEVLMNNIFGKLGEFQGVTFQMTQTQPREGDIFVGTLIKRPNQQANTVQWVVSGASGQPRIIDVIAEGTSLRLTQRADYAAFLQSKNGNVAALITAMRQQISRG